VTAAAIDSVTINSGGAVYIQGTVNGGTIDAPSGGIGGYGYSNWGVRARSTG